MIIWKCENCGLTNYYRGDGLACLCGAAKHWNTYRLHLCDEQQQTRPDEYWQYMAKLFLIKDSRAGWLL